MQKNSGFTIFELLTVIAIIGILTAIAVPNMIGWRSGANFRGLPAILDTLVVVASGGDQRQIQLNRLGRINIQ